MPGMMQLKKERLMAVKGSCTWPHQLKTCSPITQKNTEMLSHLEACRSPRQARMSE